MKIAGITAEYNPLHNGHVYHMEETRRLTSCNALVVAMSGDFVQRGEPAVLDKWIRTEQALRAGADLVIEIPAFFSLGNASQFAAASVSLLEALGCDVISFGSECGDIRLIKNAADLISLNKGCVDEGISALIKKGVSYPAAREQVIRTICRQKAYPEDVLSVVSEPNDILAVEYISNMKTAAPLAIKRQGAHYNSRGRYIKAKYQSSTYLRDVIRVGAAGSSELYKEVPEYVFDSLVEYTPVFSEDAFDLLRYAILSKDADETDACPSGGEGLGNLMKANIRTAGSMEDLILSVKSKRYTYTRISRLCMQILLGINRNAFRSPAPGYIRILGFNERGREVLALCRNREKETCLNSGISIPLITNINKECDRLDKEASKLLELDVHAADIYNLIAGRDADRYSDHRMKPVIL